MAPTFRPIGNPNKKFLNIIDENGQQDTVCDYVR